MQFPTFRAHIAAALTGLFVLAGSGCAQVAQAEPPHGPVVSAPAPEKPKEVVRPIAGDTAAARILKAAKATRGTKILVSTKQRQLWLVTDTDTLMSAPVAVGMGKDFVFNGRKFHFSTPTGRRKVLSKSEAPVWTVPEWHYMERASWTKSELVYLKPDSKVELSDGTWLEVRGNDVGRVNHFGNFWAIEPGLEIMFDDKVFVPPLTTRQRRVPDALGPFKLDMGEGYLIHGTHIHNEDSVGDAVSHGCVRMDNFDLERLYFMVEPGTPVFIF